MGACLQRCQPCLDGQVCTPASVALPPPDEFERSAVVAAVGRDQALPSQQPSSQRFVLSFESGLQSGLVADVGSCRVPQVEGEPGSKAREMSSDRAQPPPNFDRLGLSKEPRHRLEVVPDVRKQLGGRQLLIELVEAENGEFCLLEHGSAYPRPLHGPEEVQQVHAERLQHGGTGEGPHHADEGSALHGCIR